jgi:hypothetical protein
MIKTKIMDNILMEWFTKSLLPPIDRDLAMVGVATEEKSIMCAQNIDLIYSQSGTLYDIIRCMLLSLNDPKNLNLRPHVDGVVGFFPMPLVPII